MSATEILAEIPRLDPDELEALRRALAAAGREIPGTGARAAGYEKLFGCMADEPAFEIPARHRWRPAPKFD